jgi:NAD(P)-dependent dehydrogenase (short-subunit alcohol dehydrogenase family)
VRWRRAIDEEDSVAVEVPDSWGLTGKVAVVTGGGAAGDGIGNGRAAAILLARAGVQVVVVDREAALAQRTVTMIAEDGGVAIAVQADVTRAEDCAAIVQTALERFGRLDLLDNNVGIGSRGTVLDETEERWRRVMQVNVDSMFLMARQVIPAMRRQGGGAIGGCTVKCVTGYLQ